MSAVSAGGRPDLRRSLRRLNSSPSENISRMTPSSESVWTIARVGDERDRDVRPDDEPGEDVAEHDRLVQPLEDDGRDRGDAEHDREGLQELVRSVHSFVGTTPASVGGNMNARSTGLWGPGNFRHSAFPATDEPRRLTARFI